MAVKRHCAPVDPDCFVAFDNDAVVVPRLWTCALVAHARNGSPHDGRTVPTSDYLTAMARRVANSDHPSQDCPLRKHCIPINASLRLHLR